MSCNITNKLTSWNIGCAKICTKLNPNPIADYKIDGFIVEDNSEFFDSNESLRQYRWQIYNNKFLIYDFGYGYFNQIIPELTNLSIYNKLNLGFQNNEIIMFLNSLDNTIVSDGDEFTLKLTVKDSNGYESLNTVEKLKFVKFVI